MINFPVWSDLGETPVGDQTRQEWEAQLNRLESYRYYFDGDIFEETQPAEVGGDESEVRLYPVGLNIVKMLCLAQADSFWGEWEEQPFTFIATDPEGASEDDLAAIELLTQIVQNSGQHMFWELALDREKYGGSVIKVRPTLDKPGHVTWYRIPVERFYAIPNPNDPDDIFHAYVMTSMSREQARIIYGVDIEDDYAVVVEQWDPEKNTTFVNGKVVDKASSKHGWGRVPFSFVPRMRTSSNWFGDALTDDVMDPQDELNMRVADTGEGINYNFHPTRWGKNLPVGFDSQQFPLGPNVFWDLGRDIGSGSPEVGILEAKVAHGDLARAHIQFLYDWTRTSQFAPPIAFGEDNGGGQRSGITLEIRMWPLLKATRRSRTYMLAGLQRAINITGRVLEQKKLSGVSDGAIKSMLEGRVSINLFPLMPRDQQARVDEVVKLRSLDPPQISTETAQTLLGRGPSEVELINKEVEELERKAKEKAEAMFTRQQALKEQNGNQTDENAPPGGIPNG